MWELIGKLPDAVVGAIIGVVGFIALLTSISKLVGSQGSGQQEADFRRDLMERNKAKEAENKRLQRQTIRLINILERAARLCPAECADFIDAELKAFFEAEDRRK